MRNRILLEYLNFKKFISFVFILNLIFNPTSIFSQILHQTKIIEIQNGLGISFVSTANDYVKKVGEEYYLDYNLSIDESSPGKPILPSQTLIIAIPPESKVEIKSIKNNNKNYSNAKLNINPQLTLNEDTTFNYKQVELSSKYLSEDVVPYEQIEVLDYFWLRNYYCVALKVNLAQFNWKNKNVQVVTDGAFDLEFNNIKPFTNFSGVLNQFDEDLKDIIVNYEDAQKYKAEKKYTSVYDTSGNWIDYTKTYYKLAIINDGIYRISYYNLTSFGISPASINPKTLKVFRQGKQIPLYVKGEDDLEFNQSDYIEFYSEKNYNPNDYRQIVTQRQDYINYLDRYNDTSFVWLTFGGDDGDRIIRKNSAPISSADTIDNYLNKQHFEKDVRLWYHSTNEPRTQLPFWQEHKIFSWLLVGNSGSQSVTFNANDFVFNTSVKTIARLISNSGDVSLNCHKHGSSLNSTTPEDTITFNFLESVNFTSTFNSNQLLDGSNTFRIFGFPSAASFHRSLVDWVDIEYIRQTKALSDSITIKIPDGFSSALRNVKISNLTTPDSLILIYKIGSDYKKIEGFSYNNGIVVFSDILQSGDKYIITKQDYNLVPEFRYSRGFINLRDNTHKADYILITHKSLTNSTTDYKQFIEDSYNLKVERVFIDDIYDEFSYGQNWAESVKEFLKYANDNWTQPSAAYTVLIGDANYDYKNIWNPAPSPRKKNLVPSYGYPVSDQWYAMWDTTSINLPQIYIGRIPANNDDEVRTYLTKNQNYIARRFDDWNKRYMLFSGGDPTDLSELELIKSTNDLLVNSYINPAPIGGKAMHFYKTTNPVTNFGPYTLEQVQNAIDSSSLFISYLGHSGTRTWDNGITEVDDIKSSFQDRNPLISDFGCSTGKFSEPDVDAFGELFVCQSSKGNAIGYLGNSSLGFFSTSVYFPGLFYKKILIDTTYSLSKAHVQAKIDMLNLSGYSDVNRVFNYCNLLIADPVIQFALPRKTNYVVNESSVNKIEQYSSNEDSVSFNIKIWNLGKTNSDSVDIVITNTFNSLVTFTDTMKIPSPFFESTKTITVNTSKNVGLHNLNIQIDPFNKVDEIYEDDNELTYSYTIYSSDLRPIEIERYYSTSIDTLNILNPVNKPEDNIDSIIVAISTRNDFSNSIEYKIPFDTIFSKIIFNSLIPDQRYWYRTRSNSPIVNWSSTYSFKNVNNNYEFYIDKDFDSSSIILKNVVFDSLSSNWKLGEVQNILKVISAGSNDGKFASIMFNNIEKLPNTFFWGMASAEIDSVTYEPYNIKYYASPNSISQNSDSLINYINSLPEGKLLALAICDDAAQTVLGFNGGTPVRRAIETLGSYFIDSVRYRESWCMLGKKGAAIGSVPESYKKLFEGFANYNVDKSFPATEGIIVYPVIGPASEWDDLVVEDSLQNGTSIDLTLFGIKKNNEIDTLQTLNSGIISLTNINPDLYSKLYFKTILKANQSYQSPVIKSVGVNFSAPAELATNYQVVETNKDSVILGEGITLSFLIYNLGKADADSFNIRVDVLNTNNTIDTTFNRFINQIKQNTNSQINFNYFTHKKGEFRFLVYIDSNNEVPEYFEDNNFLTKSFSVRGDDSPPSIKITFDGAEVLNGDFVSNNPNIKVMVNDESILPITDPNLVRVFLNLDEVNRQEINDSSFTQDHSLLYKPMLEDDSYLLTVIAEDNSGNTDTTEVYFEVSSDTKLHQVYNYPNPFANETYFTFRLSQIPDEVRIKIFTISGRLIHEITKKSSELNYDLNKILWDGKDKDGDVIANGTYLYKIIMKNDKIVESVTQKLVILK